MKTWDDFYGLVHADVPGVLGLAAARALRQAAHEFCEKTKVWRLELDPVYLFPKVDLYDVDVPKGVTIVKIENGTYADGTPADLRAAGYQGTGLHFLSQLQFRAVPMPTARAIVRFMAIVVPSTDSAGISDELFNQYGEIIAKGAKARLYAQPQKTYTDAALADLLRAEFELEIAREKISAAKAFSDAPLRVKAQFL